MRGIRGALAVACVLGALAVSGCAPDAGYEPYASAEAAAVDYATGVLAGDAEQASRAAGGELDEAALERARLDLFGLSNELPGATVVVRVGKMREAGGEEKDLHANLFLVDSYETREGETVEFPTDDAPEIWVSEVEPWRVLPMESQESAQLFVKIALVVLGLAIVAVVVVLIRMADNDYGDAAGP